MGTRLGFGFLRLPKQGDSCDWAAVDAMTDLFLAGGGVYFDTCYTYLEGRSEEGIRRCVAERYPRERFQVADKIPGYLCKSYGDCQRFFDEERRRCGVDYFDMLMLHSLNGEFYDIARRQDQFRFLEEKRAEGAAVRTGFSFHDRPELLEEILTDHPEVDAVQLQINYLDWESEGIQARACYETCVRHGKKVIVMEPVKGGTLAAVPPEAEALLRTAHPDWSPASWALRFAMSLPEAEICLSGMNTAAQVEENLRPVPPLTAEELAVLDRVRDTVLRRTAVGCTGCGYCASHCPMTIPIPEIFRMYNELSRYPEDDWKILPGYQYLTKNTGKAADCIGCGTCLSYCPQRLQIPAGLRRAAAKLK